MAEATTVAETGVVFKGRMMMLTVLEIRDSDCDLICEQIDRHLARAPGFFARKPVLLSLKGSVPDLVELTERLHKAELFVAGVLDADDKTAQAAAAAGLGNISSPSRGTETRQDITPPPSSQDPQPETHTPLTSKSADEPVRKPGQLITQPIRSGRQIYARDGDLVIATSVSQGAEILADGHIHVYGVLRGRAIAGASGDTTARIYCRRFEPDLVAIAGHYQVADTMDENVRSKPVMVRLKNDNLIIELQE